MEGDVARIATLIVTSFSALVSSISLYVLLRVAYFAGKLVQRVEGLDGRVAEAGPIVRRIDSLETQVRNISRYGDARAASRGAS